MSDGMFIPTRKASGNAIITLREDAFDSSGSSSADESNNAKYSRLWGRRAVEVLNNEKLDEGVYRLTLRDSEIAKKAAPAQFVNLYSPDPTAMLPRPFGVASVEGDTFTLIFAVIGKGTAKFAELKPGDSIDALGPLGLGFNISKPAHYALVSGGLGVPPILCAAQALSKREDSSVTAVLGYRNKRFADDLTKEYISDVHSITNAEGTVITLLDELEKVKHFDFEDDLPTVILSCGPLPMMKAVAHWAHERNIECQLSLEARMGCGYGTCVACVVDTLEGRLKVCNDGPVFDANRLGWE